MRNGIIITLLTIILGLLGNYIVSDKPELKYNLSERIPSDFSDKVEEAGVQQLTINNTGDITLTSIVTKINSSVIDYQIKKFRHIDSISISKTSNFLEIVYPELPPKGQFTVILKTPYSGLTNNEIEIIHNKGIAKEAFSGKESNSLYIATIIIYVIIVLFFIVGFWQFTINDYHRYCYNNPYKEILTKKMPWFFSSKKWEKLRKEAISNIFNNEFDISIEESLMYKILNNDKNENLSDDEWGFIKNKSEKKLALIIVKNIYENFEFNFSTQICRLKKPKYISDPIWDDIRNIISKSYCNEKIYSLLKYNTSKSVSDVLKRDKPEFVFQEHWLETREVIHSMYLYLIIKETSSIYRLQNIKTEFDLNLITESLRNELIRIIESIEKSIHLEEYYDKLYSILEDIIFLKELPNKNPSY